MTQRITQVLRSGEWATVDFRSLTKGDIFRLFDPIDGKYQPVDWAGDTMFYCNSNPLPDENGIYGCNAEKLEDEGMRPMWIGDKATINKPNTNADGKEGTFWGIDNLGQAYGTVGELKPDVVFRFVYHVDCPDGGEGYYDQVQLRANEFAPVDPKVFVPGVEMPVELGEPQGE